MSSVDLIRTPDNEKLMATAYNLSNRIAGFWLPLSFPLPKFLLGQFNVKTPSPAEIKDAQPALPFSTPSPSPSMKIKLKFPQVSEQPASMPSKTTASNNSNSNNNKKRKHSHTFQVAAMTLSKSVCTPKRTRKVRTQHTVERSIVTRSMARDMEKKKQKDASCLGANILKNTEEIVDSGSCPSRFPVQPKTDPVDAIIREADYSRETCDELEFHFPRNGCDKISNYEEITFLGKGAYAKVTLVRNIGTEEEFVLKALPRNCDSICPRMLINEKTVLDQCKSFPYINQLVSSFGDDDYLYMVFSYVKSMELFYLINSYRTCRKSEEAIRSIICEVIVTLEFLHSKDIVYRDLKPENMLVDEEGHILVVDFGFAEKLSFPDGSAPNLVGTLDYLAPEVIAKLGGGKPADMWGLGILIYELFQGKSLFPKGVHTIGRGYSDGNFTRFKDLNEAKSESISPLINDLLSHLICQNRDERYTASEIQKHPWFKGVQWQKIRNRMRKAVLIPLSTMEEGAPEPWEEVSYRVQS